MPTLSKIASYQLRNYSCRALLHPGYSCTEVALRNLVHYIPSSAKFFFPLAFIPLVMRIKKMNRKIFWRYVSYYFELCLAAYVFGNVIAISICLYRKVLGRFNYYTVMLYPTLLVNFFYFALTKRVARAFAINIFQVLIEVLLRRKSNIITRKISESNTLQTLLFMLSSSFILHILKNNKLKVFWFIQPIIKILPKEEIITENKNESVNENEKSSRENFKCSHQEDCLKCFNQGIKSYALIGSALEIVKLIIAKPNRKTNNFYDYILSKFDKFNFNTIKFLVSYVGLYRGTNCFLNNYLDIDTDTSHILASFIGGISYSFLPKPLILSYALTTSAELLWWRFIMKSKSKSKLIKRISKIDISRLVIIPGMAIMLHLYIFHNHLINSVGSGIANAATNHAALMAHTRVKLILSEYLD